MRRGDTRPGRPRIFGIGLNKTGTTSLHEAFEILGFESLHWGGPPVRRAVERAMAAGEPALAGLDPRYDAFCDIEPIYRSFEVVDRQYPGSRFVHTFRPRADWIDSRRRHVERNVARKAAGEYTGTFLEVDVAAWEEEWDHHVERVHAYFAGRDDFLELDITARPGWSGLCAFLGVDEPAEDFPWSNRDRRADARPLTGE